MLKPSAFRVGCLLGLFLVIPTTVAPSPARGESPPAAPATANPAVSFAGEWRSTFGPMTLTQKGDLIQGIYRGPTSGTLTGKLNGRRFTFTYTEVAAAGEGWFELAEDGQSFKGRWRETGAKEWGEWEGKLSSSPDSYAGLWQTTYGRMRLHQTGNTVRGVYEYGDVSRIEGTIVKGVLQFRYTEPDGEHGEGSFSMASDGLSFAGTWKVAKGGKANVVAGGAWTGTRVPARPDIIWLVILESHWEHGLAEQEYSFGLMLRTFFARVPSVQVRHRFFGNEAEFRRWCGELTFLAEPVVLHISSHGTREGITCGKQTLGADVLIDCLRDAGDLRVLHFGACLIAGGDIPNKIFKALGSSATFPITGYVNQADWGGSAVVDFTYLDLLLARGLSPADAVAQTRKMVTFARENADANDVISGAGLIFLDPKSAAATQPATGAKVER